MTITESRRAGAERLLDVDLRLAESSVVSMVGNTPLVPLRRLHRALALPESITLWLKAEWSNPGGSIKDRTARSIIRAALMAGTLGPGQTLVDSTSGNTGIAYAMLGAALDVPVRLVVPENASTERKRILRAYGAELIFSDPYDGSDGAIRLVRELVQAGDSSIFFADQYNNPANVTAHLTTTGPEIWRQTHGAVTHLVAALGTTGTVVGTGTFLKRQGPVQVIAVQPAEAFHGIEGLKHLPTAIVPGIFEPSVPDEIVGIETEDAFAFARRLATNEGLFAGSSTGANLAATAALAAQLAARGESATIVAIGCDGGGRYLTTGLWDVDGHGG